MLAVLNIRRRVRIRATLRRDQSWNTHVLSQVLIFRLAQVSLHIQLRVQTLVRLLVSEHACFEFRHVPLAIILSHVDLLDRRAVLNRAHLI